MVNHQVFTQAVDVGARQREDTFDSTGLEAKLASLTGRRASRLGVTRPTILQSFDQLFRGVSIAGLAADLLPLLLEDDDVLTVEPVSQSGRIDLMRFAMSSFKPYSLY